jgi:hypothetical protein
LRQATQAQPSSYRARIALARFYLASAHPNPGAAGFKRERPMVIAGIAASTTTPIAIRRISLFLAASFRGMSISMFGDDEAPRLPIRA